MRHHPSPSAPADPSRFAPSPAFRAALLTLGMTLSASLLAAPTIEGPIPGSPPGDPASSDLAETYPFFATYDDLAKRRYVEEEFYLSGEADAYATDGTLLAEDVPYRTRILVRRPISEARSNGVVLMEWQNVTAGYDLDALWHGEQIMRDGYTWIGVSAQRVGVNQLREWSPTRYGELDVTADGEWMTDQLSYEIFAQAAEAVRGPEGADPMGGLSVDKIIAMGGSQSAGRMTVYYDRILPQIENPVFDGYEFIVGTAPTREGDEPVFHILSETDVRTPLGRRPDSPVYRRWEVAGTAHSGYQGQEYRRPLSERDLAGGAPQYNCALEPFSRVPLHHVIAAAHEHMIDWIDGELPPSAPYLEFDGNVKARDELGLAQGGIQLSQVTAPTAINTGSNAGESFCFLFGSYEPLDDQALAELYRNHGRYVTAVARTDSENVRAGYLLRDDARDNLRAAAQSDVGKKRR
ncbi:hypothetical protein SAMN05216421_3080 [Halopseudomonas xinjiangensis]|uniref:Alpha/beta hydrolase domain-containing protein n=1 Tax=Halopseudomonas xinjiangensis TaxID=487184 RepID=A0A1H1Y8H6_9GAMM|nr:alpha/beta hydrolase domain-containing protein [Halopseudomonas xinjiangensis]SDT17818.1 hypothetical protein SAMN05216421_3080 [Halopseudomonas xinjiangensis]